MTIRIQGSISGRRVDLTIDGVELSPPVQPPLAGRPDLSALTDSELSDLRSAALEEMQSRRTSQPPNDPGMAGWRSPGGAGQWNG